MSEALPGELQDLSVAMGRVEILERADPVGRANASPKQKEVFGHVLSGLETAMRAGNNAAKTTGLALLYSALAEGRKGVVGIPLPRLRQPTTWWVLSRTYKQQADSVQPPYENWIGDWPHQPVYLNSKKGWLEQINVKYEGCQSDDPTAWSKIVFVSQHQQGDSGDIGKGVKIDGWHFDEPGVISVIRELRKARIAGRPFFRAHTYTPLSRDQWEPYRIDFDGCTGAPRGNRIEIVASLYDNAIQNGGFLDPDEIKDFLEAFKDDPFLDARIWGDFVDLSGQNPFRAQFEQLRRWADRASEPDIETLTVMAEEDLPDGRHKLPIVVRVEIHGNAKPGEPCYMPGDPSLGVDDPEHDPCGCHVYGTDPFRLLARYNGFSGAYGLGMIMGWMGERYNDALADPDMTGGYGGPTLTALREYRSEKHQFGYGNINRDTKSDGPAVRTRSTLGYTINQTNKAAMIEGVRMCLQHDSCIMPSRAIIDCLKSSVMDKLGRLLKPKGIHYEDLINFGRAINVVQPHWTDQDQRSREMQLDEFIDRELHGGMLPRSRRRVVVPKLRWRR